MTMRPLRDPLLYQPWAPYLPVESHTIGPFPSRPMQIRRRIIVVYTLHLRH